ncbi:MAG TPA: cytochrome b/b6 domain-containing protein [Rhodoblastus sp.]|mgnify:CR=1 FL=1|nr:cytochrome b/b6 domain-containing protein [Rhodoblastus sp.]
MSMSAQSPSATAGGARALAWDGPTRLFKWSLVLVVFDGWLSNAVGGSYPAWHKWNGYAALTLILFRAMWGVVGGSTARFANFVALPGRAFAYVTAAASGRPQKYLGHNPIGGWMVLALLALVGLQAVSGLFAADEDRLVIEGPLVKFVSDAAVSFAARWHHRIFEAIEILVALHVAANLFATFVKREPLIQGMVTGSKPAEPYVDETSARPGSWLAATACLAIAAAVVFGGITAVGGRL